MNKVMIIEDETIVLDNLQELFETCGYQAIPARNGKEALSALQTVIPDIIVSDISMPGIDGYELLEKLQAEKTTSRIPFIFLTAKTTPGEIRKGMNHGADDYITKPYDARELIKAVEKRLEKRQIIEDEMDELRNNITKYLPHELRTPLVAISGYSEMILEEYYSLSPDEVLEMVAKIRAGNTRLHKTIEKFIFYSELVLLGQDVKGLQETKQEITDDAHEVVEEIIIRRSGECSRRKDLSYRLEPCCLGISEIYFRHLIEEVIENAFRFSYDGDPVEVTGRNEDEYYSVTIKDGGRGLSSEKIGKINAFVQFDRDEYQQSGNGLGLVIAKKILGIFEGRFSISSKIAAYTEVKLMIKRSKYKHDGGIK